MGFLVLQIWFLDHFSITRGGLEPSAIDGLSRHSGRKNVLRKLLRIPYRRLKAGIFCVLTVGVQSEVQVQTFAPCKAFLFDMTCLLFFSSLENYFGFRTTNVKGKTVIPSV